MPEYEIDHGEPEEPQPATDRRSRERELAEPVPPERAAARNAAVARIQEGGRQRHAVDALGLALAGLCGQGLGGATVIESWSNGASLGLLAALAGLGLAGWLWRRPRLAAEALHDTPVPLDDATIARMALHDERRRAVEDQRREAEFARLELLASQLEALQRPLRLAAWGALGGSGCAWVCAFGGPKGGATLAASIAAFTGAVIAWRIAGGGWTARQVQRTVAAALPGAAAVAALLVGAPLPWALGGGIAAAAAAWHWRRRISGLAGCAEEPVVGP